MIPIPATLSNDFTALKDLEPLVMPIITATTNNVLLPAITKLTKSFALKRKLQPDKIQKAFEEYLLRTYGRLSFMNTIVFGNQQKKISELYIPLTVRSSGPSNEQFLIDGWHKEFLPVYQRVVITDTAGMGKSTILKKLYLNSLGSEEGIPIFVELRTLSAKKTIIDKIYEDLCNFDTPFDKDLLLKLLTSGNFIFFLDGFDEVAFEDRCAVTDDLQDFITKAHNNLFVLSSRHEAALGSFGNFREFSINPLNKTEAYNLLRKYDETQEHAEALIAELESGRYEQLKDLMVNPMLVSLLFKAYSYKPKLPFKKQIFYRQVFDALFDMHDSTKGGAFVRKKNCGLDIDEFHLVMRYLGFRTAKLGSIEYSKDEICNEIKKVRERNSTILFQPTALLTDLVTTVPLFNREGEHFKWAHKSVQDYFASQFIALDAKTNEVKILTRIYDSGHCRRYDNILDILHDTDNKSFRRVLLAKLLKDFINHYENQDFSFLKGVSDDAIEKRKQLTFGYNSVIIIPNKKEYDLIFNGTLKKGPKNLLIGFLDDFEYDSLFLIHFAKKRLLIADKSKPAAGLLPLLARKKYPYIEKPKSIHEESIFKKLPSNGSFIVTDDPESILNSPKCFEAVNQLLCNHGFYISIEQARRTLKSLEDEDDESLHVDDLLENL